MSPLPENIMPLGIARTTSMNSIFKDMYPHQRFCRLQDEEIQDMANDPETYTKEQVIRRVDAALADPNLPLLFMVTYEIYQGYLVDDKTESDRLIYNAHLHLVQLIDNADWMRINGVIHDLELHVDDLARSLNKAIMAKAAKEVGERAVRERMERRAERIARVKVSIFKIKETVTGRARNLINGTNPKPRDEPKTVWHDKGNFGGSVETIQKDDKRFSEKCSDKENEGTAETSKSR